ncbi:MAG: response regulator [Treponemataceae bacterium]|nr:response regulator [Treponemataceae bacterium]
MGAVLVIDDDTTILEVVEAILAKKNYTTYRAQTTSEAYHILETQPIDLILLDIILPGQGGMEFLMELKEKHPGIPVIIMSGKVRTDTSPFKHLALQFGAHCILSKPFTVEELLKAVEVALGGGYN